MSRKVWCLVFFGVLLLHGGLFLIVKDGPALPRQWFIDRSPPEPTFKYGEARYVDPETGEKMKVQEFTLRVPDNKNEKKQPGFSLPQPAPTLTP